MATVFLSHASRNDALAHQLALWLTLNGFSDLFVDHSSIRGGDKWASALREAKGSCRVVLCLVTPEWLASEECFGEFMAAWYQGKRIIPMFTTASAVLDDAQKRRFARVLAEDQGFEITACIHEGALDIDRSEAVSDGLRKGLKAGGAIERIGLDPFQFDEDKKALPDPFPGLQSFGDTDADAAVFFGRGFEISRCLEELREMRAQGDRRPLAILGASGSGKSSLLKAGVLPRLRRERGWLALRSFRPGANPLLNFSDAIVRTANAGENGPSTGAVRERLLRAWRDQANVSDAKQAREALRKELDSLLLPLCAKANRREATVLISIDQAEELVRLPGDASESADALCDYVRASLEPPDPTLEDAEVVAGYRLAYTVRSDSFHELQRAPRMHSLECRGVDIRPVPPFRYVEAVERPAERYGVVIEPELTRALMEDSPGEEALPLLAFALHRLWKEYASEKMLRRAAYEKAGKLAGLIEDAAERALGGQAPVEDAPRPAVSDDRNRLGADTFIALTQVNDQGQPLRRVVPTSSLKTSERDLLGHFDKWRLVVHKPGDAPEDATVEPAHEALFRGWPRFERWLDSVRAELDVLRGLERAAASWRRNGEKAKDLYYRGKHLQEAERLLRVGVHKSRINRDMERYVHKCANAQLWRRTYRGAAIALVSAGLSAAITAYLLGAFQLPAAAAPKPQAPSEAIARNP